MGKFWYKINWKMPFTTIEIVLAYHHAFYRNDKAAVRQLLADEGTFIGPLNSFTNPDLFIDAAAIFMKLTSKTDIKKIFTDGNDACILYDSTYIVPSIPILPIASWFKVESGKINFFHVHFDPSRFLNAKENGEIAKVLATA
jgi:limonene-1,2-epoxide hydrolase